jgi:beta-ribofuranosylaminobenzene 5'-phosphate synthase
MIEITTPSRIHITLIDLNGALGRVDGSIGIALDFPVIKIQAKKSDNLTVLGKSTFSERVKKVLQTLITAYKTGGIEINIVEDYPDHVGLGSGTQASLAAGMAINRLYDLNLSPVDIARLAKRGGTSGIGIEAYNHGGFIIDGGHKGKCEFKPSSASGEYTPPSILIRHDFPDWDIIVAIPNLKGASNEKEVDIFKKECPIPLREIRALSHIILMEMLPSVIEEDIESFGASINKIQNVGFKRREVKLQPFCVRLMEFMNESGAYGAGMSSFGPTVYAITDDKSLKNVVQRYLNETTSGKVYCVKACNCGARVRVF